MAFLSRSIETKTSSRDHLVIVKEREFDRSSFFFAGKRANPCNRERERERSVDVGKSCLGIFKYLKKNIK